MYVCAHDTLMPYLHPLSHAWTQIKHTGIHSYMRKYRAIHSYMRKYTAIHSYMRKYTQPYAHTLCTHSTLNVNAFTCAHYTLLRITQKLDCCIACRWGSLGMMPSKGPRGMYMMLFEGVCSLFGTMPFEDDAFRGS